MDSTKNFSGLANTYTAGRPAYAVGFIHSLYTDHGFSPQSVIADIGAGTGKFTKQLLDRGSTVYCVEPNDDMRETAAGELGGMRTTSPRSARCSIRMPRTASSPWRIKRWFITVRCKSIGKNLRKSKVKFRCIFADRWV